MKNNIIMYDNYLEISMNDIFSKVKNVWNNVIARFKVKKESQYEIEYDEALLKLKKLLQAIGEENRFNALINEIANITKDVISKKTLNEEIATEDEDDNDNDDDYQPLSIKDMKDELMTKVKKGFIPSATFYPTLKFFEQFILILTGEKTFSQLSFNLNSNELLMILCTMFVYLSFKMTKEIRDIKKKHKEEYEKDIKEKRTRKQEINSRIQKELERNLWSKQKMDEWIKQKLWSRDELERMLDEKLKKITSQNEESINMGEYKEYLEYVQSDSKLEKVRKFVNAIKNLKNKSLKFITNILIHLLSKLPEEEQKLIINSIPSREVIFEDIYNEGFFKSIKEFAKELYPALAFYPALTVWLTLDKIIQDGRIGSITKQEANQLIFYASLFIGVVGMKIGKDRILELLEKKKQNKEQKNKREEQIQLAEKKIHLRRIK